jgi:hypothetical protein
MSPYAAGYAFGQLILLLAFLTPAFLFLRAQQRVLTLVRPENRRMHPGLVWLQLIPLFNWVWIFFVVRRIADSLAKQYAALQSDSILGIVDEQSIKDFGKRPTYTIGLSYCILIDSIFFLSVFVNLFTDAAHPPGDVFYGIFGLTVGLLALGGFSCWIVYWVQLAEYKNKLKQALAVA